MKHMRHWLMMVALLCGLTANAYDFEVDGIYYNIISSSDLTVEVILGSNKYSGAVSIPSTVTYNSKAYGVTGIGNYAFEDCDALTSIVISEGVMNIGFCAFGYCDVLTSITLPETLTSIRSNAFRACSSLTSIIIPEGVTSIGDYAFDGCNSLTSITIPKGVTSIGNYVFSGCNSLTSITIPEGVTSIGNYVFSGCSSLTSITIPASVTSIGKYAFEDCISLTSITIPEGVTSIGSDAFRGCISLTSITIPEGVTSIGNFAFYFCSSLTSITIPASVTSIGNSAFYGCSSLTSITIPASVTSIGNSAFSGCNSLTSMIVAKENAKYDSRNDCNAIIETSSNTLVVGSSSTVIPTNVTSIGNSAFYFCSSLTSITIPASVTSIGNSAFSHCDSLISITFAEGVTSIGSKAFRYSDGLTSITIPASVTSIGEYAFSDCTSLTEVYCFLIDPIEYDNLFYGCPIETIYVPNASVNLYLEDKGWKDYNIAPMFVGDKLVVNLPKVASDVDYRNMYIELVETDGDMINKYLIGEQHSYTFYGLDGNRTYSIYLKNQLGHVLGAIHAIHIFEDATVTFDSLLQPQNLKIGIYTPDGTDATESAIVTWYDANDNYLCKDAVLSGQVEDTEVKYTVKLSKELAMQYKQPEQTTYMVKPSGNEVKVILEPFSTAEITGMVRDSVTGTPVRDAMVTFSQKLNGEYAHITRAETDNKGAFKATLYDVPAEVTVAAADYISYTMSLDTLTEATALGDILMKPISGVVVSVGFTYRTSVPDGDTPDILDWYSDYANVKYGILNKTTGLPVSNFSVQYPQLVLLDGVSAGNELLLTVVSRTNSFEPTQTTAVVDSALQCDATFDIVELGGIEASYTTTTNSAVVGILYNEIGEMVQKRSYSSGSLTLDNLRDGSYTLVTMGSSDYFNAIYNLLQLSAVGLVEGTDYVKHAVKVESGVVSVVEMESVPVFDESRLYYTGGDTRFTVNKTSATAGNYLTLTGKIDFKEEYASKVSGVSMVIDIPESAIFVDNSVMVGTTIAPYTLEGNRLIISLSNNYTERVRFCIIPTESGSYAPTAFARFTIDGKEVLQPIGSAHYTIKDLSIEVPSISAKTTIPVSGMALANSTIQIYDNRVLIGETTSLANGVWSTTCELDEPYNLSTHSIYAKVTNKQGLELQSETRDCVYDMNAIEVRTVTMSFYNGWLRKNVEVVFDFENNKTSDTSYMFYTGTDITFVADLTNNDTAVVSDVKIYVFTDKDEVRELPAVYDAKNDKWVAVSRFESNNLPINVSVDYVAQTPTVIDSYELDASRKDLENISDSYNQILARLEDAKNDETGEEMKNLLVDLGLVTDSIVDEEMMVFNAMLDSMTDEEFEAYGDVLDKEITAFLDNNQGFTNSVLKELNVTQDFDFSTDEGAKMLITNDSAYVEEDLLLNGYEQIYLTNGGSIYYLETDSVFCVVDLINHTVVEIQYSKDALNDSLSDEERAKYRSRDVAILIRNAILGVNEAVQTIKGFHDDLMNRLLQSEDEIRKAGKAIDGQLNKALNYFNRSKNPLKQTYWMSKIIAIQAQKVSNSLALSIANQCRPLIRKVIPILDYIDMINKLIADINTAGDLYLSIPEPCPNDQSDADIYAAQSLSLIDVFAGYATGRILLRAQGDAKIAGGIVAALPSGGTSLLASLWGLIDKVVIGMALDFAYEKTRNYAIQSIRNNIATLDCYKECPKCGKNPCICKTPPPPLEPVSPIHDPSGYVYEGVSSNRVEGVMASCYYKETVEDIYGDQHENVVLWDAEQYAQENPLFTDANGMYRWDVPKGLWQVKFEKEGYETTYSEWLPVPPPQLEVNIPMVQNKQPEVAGVHAYKDGVEIEFDKYMQPATLNTDNIFVTQNDEKVAGTITLLNEEVAYEDKSETYASKVRFVFDQAVTAKEITLTVVNSVKSYAGLQMQDTYIQTFAIEQEVEGIVADSLVSMYYGGEQTLTVKVIPAAAAAGKTLVVTSSSPMILGVDTDSIVLDDSGEAVLTVSGELPGMGAISYSLVGYDYRASTLVEVVYNNTKMTANPTASIASGTTVAKGTEVTLSCTTEGAAIYYTLDGSCPCDDTAILYDGTPIVINENTELRIMAVAEGMYESDVVVYNYYVEGADVEEVTLPFGIDPTVVTDGFRVQGIETECTVAVYGVGGELVMQREHVKNNTLINIAHVPEGMYIVVVSKDDDTHKQRILKVK